MAHDTEQRLYALDQLADAIPIPIMRLDEHGGCVHVNRHWRSFTGVETAAARGDGWLSLIHPDDRDRCREWHHSAWARHETLEQDFRLVLPDGRTPLVASRVAPQYDPAGTVLGHLCVCVDVSERREGEEALRTLTHQYRERIKELDCLYGLADIVERAGGDIPAILQAATELLPRSWEYPTIAFARTTFEGREYRTPNYRGTPWRQRAPILQHGETAGHIEVGYLVPRPERTEGPFQAEERRLLDAVALKLGHVIERVRAEQTVQQQAHDIRERLTHLSRVSTLGEMASSIAHEVNQPLTAIATYTAACRRLIEQGAYDTKGTLDILSRIGREALRAGGIVHRLKELVRKRESRREPCDVNAMIREVEQLAAVDSRLHDTALQLDLAPELPAVTADGVQVQQVILNLVRNAVDALEAADAPHRSVVVHTALEHGAGVTVSVSDEGCGLPDGVGEELFQPFFTTKEDGLGMGLSISRSIVAAHGGRLWFERHPDRGTTFYFTLPVSTGGRDERT